jgi:tRNA(Ile2) C34 agmatinyltransferase TiaS
VDWGFLVHPVTKELNMICKKCGKDVTLEGIECPKCGYSHIEEDKIVIKKQIVNDKIEIGKNSKPNVVIKKNRFFKKGKK